MPHDDLLDAVRYALGASNMGCDIHIYGEVKKDGKWVAEQAASYFEEDEAGNPVKPGESGSYCDMANTGDHGRSYWLFGLLSEGVRRKWDFAFPQKGIPEDASDEVRKIHTRWDVDAHSASHLTVQELKKKAAALLLLNTTDAGEALELLTPFIDSLQHPDSIPTEDRRIVFWFDN